jgi:hypothetical protein
MECLRIANRHVRDAVLLMTVLTAATSASAANPSSVSGRSAAETQDLATTFQERLASSLFVLVPADAIGVSGRVAQAPPASILPTALTGQAAPRSNLVAALLASNNLGLGRRSEPAAAAANPGQNHGRRPVSPNHPPDRPPGPPDEPPGPPDGVPPGPPDGVPNGPKPK